MTHSVSSWPQVDYRRAFPRRHRHQHCLARLCISRHLHFEELAWLYERKSMLKSIQMSRCIPSCVYRCIPSLLDFLQEAATCCCLVPKESTKIMKYNSCNVPEFHSWGWICWKQTSKTLDHQSWIKANSQLRNLTQSTETQLEKGRLCESTKDSWHLAFQFNLVIEKRKITCKLEDFGS